MRAQQLPNRGASSSGIKRGENSKGTMRTVSAKRVGHGKTVSGMWGVSPEIDADSAS